MKAVPLFSLLVPFCVSVLTLAHADDWRSKYSTGKKGEDFEACCGINDSRTAKSLASTGFAMIFPPSIRPKTQRLGSATWKHLSSRYRSACFSRAV